MIIAYSIKSSKNGSADAQVVHQSCSGAKKNNQIAANCICTSRNAVILFIAFNIPGTTLVSDPFLRVSNRDVINSSEVTALIGRTNSCAA